MEHRFNLNPEPFEMMKNGKKCVEMRLYDEKRRLINVGDTIIFAHTEGTEELRVSVTELNVYKDFYELYKHYDKTEIGYRPDEPSDPADMYSFYPKEKIEKYGVLAIKVEIV